MDKIAIISDIHGNLTALEAVIADIKAKAVDEVWVLGDILMPGPGGKQILELLHSLQPTVFIRGNWDDLLLHGLAGKIELVKPSHVYFSKLAMTCGQDLGKAELDFLAKNPIQQTLTRGPLTISVSHNLPELNYGQKLYPTRPQTDFDAVLEGIQADLAVYAHVHHQLMRYTTAEQIVLNPGSVGEPFCKVAYDHQKELALAKKADIAYLELYEKLLTTGKVYTHDQKLLAQYNEKYGYEQEVIAYQNKVR